MAEKDKNPVRGMQPMDDYNTTNKLKELAPLGVGLGLAGAAMTVSKKGAEGDAARKKAREAAEKKAEKDKEQQFREDRSRLRSAIQSGIDKKPNTDRINMGTYVPGFEQGRDIDVEEGMKGLREAENEMKRESSRGGKAAARDTSVRGKIREMTGMKKGGKVSSASSRADGIAQRGKTRGMMK